jgi:hypothetical protein
MERRRGSRSKVHFGRKTLANMAPMKKLLLPRAIEAMFATALFPDFWFPQERGSHPSLERYVERILVRKGPFDRRDRKGL